MIGYLEGALMGAICGVVSLLLAYSGLERKGLKRLRRLARWRIITGKHVLLFAVVGAAIGCYGVWLYEGINSDWTRTMLLCTCLLSVSVSDVRHHTVQINIVILFAVLGLAARVAASGLAVLPNALTGTAVGAFLLGVPYLLRKGSVGVGDVAMTALCGLYSGLPAVIYLLARALLMVAVVSVIQLLRKKATGKSEMPFAPFLLLGALI